MAATRVISIVGKKDAGKTSLVVALASEWVKRGRRVATIKHGAHPAEVDKPGTDTHRHYTEGMAERVLMEFPGGRVLFERTTEQAEDPLALVRRFLNGVDIVVVEGYKKSSLPKIEVHRKSKHPEPLFDAKSADGKLWVALVTDDEQLRVSIPTFRFTDTGWLVTLAQLAWDRAVVVE